MEEKKIIHCGFSHTIPYNGKGVYYKLSVDSYPIEIKDKKMKKGGISTNEVKEFWREMDKASEEFIEEKKKKEKEAKNILR